MTGEKEYLDEIIIRRRRELEKSRHSCIQSGIYAGEELITFSETELFDGTVKVFLPETFTDMPDEIRNVKYSSTNSPSVIKMKEGGEIVFSFQMAEKSIDDSNLEEMLRKFQGILKKSQPASILLDKGIEERNHKGIAWMDYKGYGIDQPLYQQLFIVPVREKMMLGMFHCPFDKSDAWKPVVKEIIKTIYTGGV